MEVQAVTFGERVLQRRIAFGVTRLDLAKVLNISPATVLKWEDGGTEPMLALALKVSKVLAFSLDSLEVSRVTDYDKRATMRAVRRAKFLKLVNEKNGTDHE